MSNSENSMIFVNIDFLKAISTDNGVEDFCNLINESISSLSFKAGLEELFDEGIENIKKMSEELLNDVKSFKFCIVCHEDSQVNNENELATIIDDLPTPDLN